MLRCNRQGNKLCGGSRIQGWLPPESGEGRERMSKKLIVARRIEFCTDCSCHSRAHGMNGTVEHHCVLLDSTIATTGTEDTPVPITRDCPLPEWSEE